MSSWQQQQQQQNDEKFPGRCFKQDLYTVKFETIFFKEYLLKHVKKTSEV